MSSKLPPIKYKVHPKMLQIIVEKRKRREVLEAARQKEQLERVELKQGRRQYMQENKKQIARKLTQIHERKVVKHNHIREEEKERPMRIAMKRVERLMHLVPQRQQLIQMLRDRYMEMIETNDREKKQRLQHLIETKIVRPQEEVKIEERVRENNIIDTNEGLCVICLTSEAHIYMTQCRHLISCKDCSFILRMQKKCPLCRRASDYQDLKEEGNNRKRKPSIKK